jgi:hypothetical protein
MMGAEMGHHSNLWAQQLSSLTIAVNSTNCITLTTVSVEVSLGCGALALPVLGRLVLKQDARIPYSVIREDYVAILSLKLV